MSLLLLDAVFLEFTNVRGALHCHYEFEKARGLHFRCPGCFVSEKQGSISLLFKDPRTPDDVSPKGRWEVFGTSMGDLTLDRPVYCSSCDWTGLIQMGEATW